MINQGNMGAGGDEAAAVKVQGRSSLFRLFLYYNHYRDQTFAIVAGAVLRVGAGPLWAGQGAIMMASGASTCLSFGPFHTELPSARDRVNDKTYIAFHLFHGCCCTPFIQNIASKSCSEG
ncbi:hypothetical protein BDE02_02G168300 [Populus trichocarpa]|uniref:Uncharacterized protein n=1 Tax=Populus trichocarpa TaxID=3694 RepID=A0A3N7G9I8_POPTR|nr:hypothetical protein BDE02_02G168300 [Populus trichocarpa]